MRECVGVGVGVCVRACVCVKVHFLTLFPQILTCDITEACSIIYNHLQFNFFFKLYVP